MSIDPIAVDTFRTLARAPLSAGSEAPEQTLELIAAAEQGLDALRGDPEVLGAAQRVIDALRAAADGGISSDEAPGIEQALESFSALGAEPLPPAAGNPETAAAPVADPVRHAPGIPRQIHEAGVWATMIDVGPGVSNQDRAVVNTRIANLPQNALDTMRGAGGRVDVFEGGLTDVPGYQELKGVQPRGWPEGSTWDSVPGVGATGPNHVDSATRASSEDGRVHRDHGSTSLSIHETAHAVDSAAGHFSYTPDWLGAPMAEGRSTGDPYYAEHLEEWFAESMARYSLSPESHAQFREQFPASAAAINARFGPPQF